MENKEHVYLWVLDFNDGQVYKYAIDKVLYNDYPDYPEEYMENLGHDTSNVQWMVSPYDEVLDENCGWEAKEIIDEPLPPCYRHCRPNTTTDR